MEEDIYTVSLSPHCIKAINDLIETWSIVLVATLMDTTWSVQCMYCKVVVIEQRCCCKHPNFQVDNEKQKYWNAAIYYAGF